MVEYKYNISIVVPVFNEEGNVEELFDRILLAMNKKNNKYEIIFVNDGSSDNTKNLLKIISNNNQNVVVVNFKRNFGQTAAMQAGIDYSTGKYIAFLDGDLQNDPEDIPKMLEEIEKGYDIISGWRFKRKDPFISRKLPSMIANSIISNITGVKLHDYGCSLKLYNGDLLRSVKLFGEMHRFIPAIVAQKGAKIKEIKVNHHPRKAGKSKYGISRTFKVILDLITVKFLGNFSTKPLHIFGFWGILTFTAGIIISLYLTILKLFYHEAIGGRPLLTLGILLIFMGIQFITIGLLGELIVRIYYQDKEQKIYYVEEIFQKKSAHNK